MIVYIFLIVVICYDTYDECGLAYARQGDYERAIADYESALRIDPNHENARRNLETAIFLRTVRER